jgi:hypothetical protein
MLNAAGAIAVELEKVIPTVPIQFMQDSIIFSRMQNFNQYKISDRLCRMPVLSQPGSIFTQFDPDSAYNGMGLGAAESYVTGVATICYFNQAVQVTARAIWATNADVKAVVDVFKNSWKINLAQFRTNLESLLCVSDGSGIIGTVTANPPYSPETDYLQVNNSNSFQAGCSYNVYTAGYAALLGPVTVNSVDSANNLIYVTSYPAGIGTGCVFLVSGAPGTQTVSYSPDVFTTATVSASLNGLPILDSNSVSGYWFGLSKNTVGLQGVLNSAYVDGDNDALTPQTFLHLESLLQRQNGSNTDDLLEFVVSANVDQITAWESFSLFTNDYLAGTPGGNTAFTDQKGTSEETRKDYLQKRRVKTMSGHEIIGSGGNIKALPQRIDLLNEKYLGRIETKPVSLYEVGGVTTFPAWVSGEGIAPVSLYYYVTGLQTTNIKPRASAFSDNLALPVGWAT